MTILKVFAEADPDTGYDSGEFAREVMATLADTRSWGQAGITFRSTVTAKQADLWIRLAQNDSVTRECGFDGMSCAWVSGKRSLINLVNWNFPDGLKKLSEFATRDEYRQYVINHETGHLLGLRDNMTRGTAEVQAPVMVQHTRGPRGYRANCWPTPVEIAKVQELGPARLVLGGAAKKKNVKKKSVKKKSVKKKSVKKKSTKKSTKKSLKKK